MSTLKKNLASMEVNSFIDYLVKNNLTKGYILNNTGNITTLPSLESFTNSITQLQDYDNHDAIFFEVDLETKSLFVAAIHKTTRGNAQGGTRLKKYDTVQSIFTDALRLSKGMTEKISFAELWWGGGKSIIHPYIPMAEVSGRDRETILTKFARFIASLNGLYVCAADMNTTSEDMRLIHSANRHTTCTPPDIGGSADPGVFTAQGVFNGILAGLHFLDKKNDIKQVDLRGKHIAIQGAGSVGFEVLNQVVKAGGKVTVSEESKATQKLIKQKFSNNDVTILENLDDIYKIKADVFSPNAIGATINTETINQLKVKLIAGGANNQLKNAERNAKELHRKGILYVPDFVINRMGIINCANEQHGYLRSEIQEEIAKIYPSIHGLLQEAREDGISPYFKAIEQANTLSKIPKPLYGHRGKLLIQDLIDQDWARA